MMRINTYLGQGIIWTCLLGAFTMLFSSRFGWWYGFERAFWMVIGYIFLVNINLIWLIPSFLHQKKYFTYFSLIAAFFGFCYGYFYLVHSAIIPLADMPFRPPINMEIPDGTDLSPMKFVVATADSVMGLLMFITSIAYSSSQLAIKKEREAIQLKSENLDTEIKFLRSQINPHFLFNALHNIYSLSVTKSDKTPQMIIMLSEMLRFVLHDCKKEKVMVSKEVTYLKNFIALSRLKDEEIKNIETCFNLENSELMIEPMMFIPFLENSFKHSKIEDTENGWIKLRMGTSTGKLNFQLENSLPSTKYTKDKVGGIGLENVRRRLALLYPDKHDLKVQKNGRSFSVELDLLV